ncbi:MAG: DUF427 domain-containing protein [Anaerolinea sp.]|jgi:uncharacterized protein (DUF427 family)|nr:DUF427 domain-containing protein [Anaerolinea sp.]
MKAIWNGAILAESDQTIVVEGNHYFPPDALRSEYFKNSGTHTTCPWKGVASYYNVVVDDKTNADAAWYYPAPKDAAKQIAGYVAFWRGVQVTK